MLDILIPVIVVSALSVGILAVWRSARKPASPLYAELRTFAVVIAISLLIGVLAWRVSKARTFQFFGAMVQRVETTDRVVALTFDDGPSPGATEDVIAVLGALDVPASFYLIGSDIERYPHLCQSLVSAGHEVGNHTYSHQVMLARPLSFIREEFEATDALLRACGYDGAIHVRTPYGKRLFDTPYYLARTGRLNIFFDVEPESYPGLPGNAEAIAAHVLDRTRPGSIILLHVMAGPHRAESLRAVPLIVEGLWAQGYQFVTVSDLLTRREVTR